MCNSISQEMEENKRLPLTLARTGSVGLSHNSISKKIGKLFIERNNVNLHFDVLDTPEFFWEQVSFVMHCQQPIHHNIIIIITIPFVCYAQSVTWYANGRW